MIEDAIWNGIVIPHHVQEKFYGWVAANRIPYRRSLQHYLWKSLEQPASNELQHAVSEIFHLKDKGSIWLRTANASPSFQLCIVGYQNTVLELVSRRGLRQLIKLWLHLAKRHVCGGIEGKRLQEIFKYTCLVKIQGGLIRGPLRPRVKRYDRKSF